MSFCPARENFTPCPHREVCKERELCSLLHHRPVDALDAPPAVHFVGFRGEEYRSAVRAFGLPDLVHLAWDRRAAAEFAVGDVVVYPKFLTTCSLYVHDDSNQDGDPAALERK